MSSLPRSRSERTPDPPSPFQPHSQPSMKNPKTRKKPDTKPQAKSDLNFIAQVTKNASGNLYWDNANETAAADAMAMTALQSATDKKQRKVAEAFQHAGQRRNVKDEFSHFCSETSFTALVRIYNASSWARRIGWIVVFVVMLGWLTYQCYTLLDKYFSYPMEVKMDILAARELDFPSVTVCNLNPIKSRELRAEPQFLPLLHFTDMIKDDDVLYDFYFENFDWIYSTTPGYGNAWSTYPSSSISPFVGTTSSAAPTGGTTGPTVPPPPPPTTPAPPPPPTTASTSPAPTETTSSSLPPPGRKKREANAYQGRPPNDNLPPDETANENRASLNKDNLPDRLHPDPEHSDVVKSYEDVHLDHGSDKAAAAGSDGNKEEDWKTLEREIFGEDVKLERFRRSVGSDASERLDVLRNNSFNKWDALDNAKMNISYYETRDAEYKSAMAYATLSHLLPADLVRKSGHDLQDLLISCRFNGWQCSPRNFTYFHNHKYGNCYTFNSLENPKNLVTKFSGPEFGLTLEMFIQQDQYVPALAAEAGVRVLIHPKGTPPFPEDNGLSIPAAHFTSVGLRQVEIDRLGPPHGTCALGGSPLDHYAAELNTRYTKLSCLKSCYQTIVNTHCNCSVPMYIVTNGTYVCNMTRTDVDVCTSMLPEKVPEEYTQCDILCHQPCTEVTYEMLISSATWPSDEYKDYLQSKLKQSNYLLMDGGDVENFVKLNVYFKDLMYQKIEQQKGYESQNLISDIGGQLGLWLGLSAITIGELCGLFLSLFRSLTAASPHRKSTTTAVQPFTRAPELDPGDDLAVTDVKARGYV